MIRCWTDSLKLRLSFFLPFLFFKPFYSVCKITKEPPLETLLASLNWTKPKTDDAFTKLFFIFLRFLFPRMKSASQIFFLNGGCAVVKSTLIETPQLIPATICRKCPPSLVNNGIIHTHYLWEEKHIIALSGTEADGKCGAQSFLLLFNLKCLMLSRQPDRSGSPKRLRCQLTSFWSLHNTLLISSLWTPRTFGQTTRGFRIL